jgi:hypothetical protein
MSQVTEHLAAIADVIGPRPATTDAEARAADYIEGVFRSRDLEVERQDFDCPRTDAWAFAIYYVLTILSAVVSRWFPWPALVVALAVPVLMWLDFDTKAGLSKFLPKGPSQNVIARHVPTSRRGERLQRVIVVAHYDTAKPSLLSSPGLVRNYAGIIKAIMVATALVPVFILLRALPFTSDLMPVTWYVTLAVAALLLVPLVAALQSELGGHAVEGANDNASGVATLLGVMEALAPVHEVGGARDTRPAPPVRRTREVAIEADVVPEEALLTYTPVTPPGHGLSDRVSSDTFDDLGWDDALPQARSAGQGAFDFEPGRDDEEPAAAPRAAAGSAAESATEEHRGLRDWLGVGKGFDVRREGRKIGSWDNFAEDEDEDEDDFGLKGGSAGELTLDDEGFAAEEAARIRRRVTSGIDRALTEKEVWFVATGAGEPGAWGMRAFLDAYADDAKDAVIINLDTVGTGSLSWVTREGVLRRRHCDRRLASSARRVAREEALAVRGRDFAGKATDAGAALARGFKAMSIMAFDINGRLANWHRPTDTADLVLPENLELAVTLTTKLIREL